LRDERVGPRNEEGRGAGDGEREEDSSWIVGREGSGSSVDFMSDKRAGE